MSKVRNPTTRRLMVLPDVISNSAPLFAVASVPQETDYVAALSEFIEREQIGLHTARCQQAVVPHVGLKHSYNKEGRLVGDLPSFELSNGHYARRNAPWLFWRYAMKPPAAYPARRHSNE